MIYLPFILQGFIMFMDEFIHTKRGLPRWERFGHPLDSLSVLAVFLFVLNFPWNPDHEKIFLGLSIFSCLFITKDEFVHTRESGGFEHWLHALLFLLHPVIFLCAWILWKKEPDHPFLVIQTVAIASFMIYQILRWSFPWPKSTTQSTKPLVKGGTKPGMTPSRSFAQKGKLKTPGSLNASEKTF